MGTNPTLNPELDDPVSHCSSVCLGTPVILRNLLEKFSNNELLQLSLVNKQWNYEARCVLRDRGTLTATILSSNPTCQSHAAFASQLKKMRVVPFSGLHVILSHNNVCQSVSNGSHDKPNKVILKRLPCKNLSVEFCDSWTKCRNCPLVALVQRISKNFSGVLETLSLTMDWQLTFFYGLYFLTPDFPRLKTLKLDLKCTPLSTLLRPPEYFKGFIKTFVSSAPNLKELHTHLDVDFDENVLEGSSAVLVPLTPLNPLRNRVCESLIGALRLETLEVYRTEVALSDATLNRLIPILLKTHLTSLKTLRMDLLFAVPLMCYGICLENVTTLIIRLDCSSVDSLEPPILELLKHFDFTCVFPKLNNVEIECDFDLTLSAEQISPFVEQGKAMLQEGQLDQVVNKKPLAIRGHMLDTTVAFLAQMFPDIQTISLEKHGYPSRMPFVFLWDHFKRLTGFEFISTMRPEWCENLDSHFCGIFEEEVAELREKDEEYLKAVNIVPVRPSMTCMKELRTFTFQYTPETYSLGRKDSLPFCFSKVTGWIVFARCPALAVTFQTASSQCAKALRLMEPFVTYTSVNT